jgi:hypothetical protein
LPEENGKKVPETLKRLCGPDNPQAGQAIELAMVLLELSTRIATQCQTASELPKMNQLILERGQVLGQLTALDMQNFPDELKDWLVECLTNCQALDQENLSSMKTHRSSWMTQLQGLKEAGNLMNKYRATSEGPPSTRWEQA